ncbi:ATP-binding cassette domain-containing protein [Metasolibacillus sp.]|uniref:ABC transporter ATP-binding protein n=1 Tax=Metasolibacillus sp. TaxID=2703680 RepID=UPI0026001C6B|nr:ATP-binding cassette domain-containing protein [Metasolibacillus sp.]MCT6924464.1 ATP-binding cassette domain-containing protein [Metasolibacillus sp.]MCT6940667.1 ATP-binding cassette domain-containing protein [Metasolibacillus sp.]
MIELQNIKLSFGEKKVLDNISNTFQQGEVIGLVAPNGTGKSTLMNVMMNYATPNSGKVVFKNNLTYSSKANEVKIHQLISMMPDQSDLYNHLSGRDHLKIYCTMWNSDPKLIDTTIEALNMGHYVNKKAGTYSLGMRQRLCFAMQIVANTEIMLMDEVMNGLDPINVEIISGVLMEKKAEGKLIVIASHLLDNLEKYADRIFLFKDGQLIDVDEVVNGFSGTAMTTVRVKNMSEDMKAAFQVRYPNLRVQTLVNDMTLLTLDKKDAETLGEMAVHLAELKINDFTFGKVTLNDLYAMYYG